MKFRKFRTDKLWRDKPVDQNEHDGNKIEWRCLDDVEFLEKLKLKIVEEAAEVAEASKHEDIIEELGDVLEVIRAFTDALGCSFDDIKKAQAAKREKRGGFDGRKYVSVIEFEEGSSGANYCLKQPDKYPEIVD